MAQKSADLDPTAAVAGGDAASAAAATSLSRSVQTSLTDLPSVVGRRVQTVSTGKVNRSNPSNTIVE